MIVGSESPEMEHEVNILFRPPGRCNLDSMFTSVTKIVLYFSQTNGRPCLTCILVDELMSSLPVILVCFAEWVLSDLLATTFRSRIELP